MIHQNHTAIGLGSKTVFSAAFGTPPYTYSIQSPSLGGSISDEGVYTAPEGGNGGTETIVVTDSTGTKKKAQVAVLSVYELICDILEKETGIKVKLFSQKVMATKDGPEITVQILSSRPFANSKRFVDGEIEQSINMLSTIQIDIWSRDLSAVTRKEEILLALNSDYAETQMENNAFRIGKIPSNFVNLCNEEGAAIPYRFNISAQVQYYVKKRKAINYYDTFEDFQVVTDK